MKRGILIASLAAAGCAHGPVYKYTRTAQNAPTANQPGCDFRVAGTLEANGAYGEIGVLDTAGWVHSHTASEFKHEVQNQVCAAGGDLVVTEVNGFGTYIRGMVFKKIDKAVTAQQ